MSVRMLRAASRLGGALLLMIVFAAAAAQQPKDPPTNPDEQKAKEAFLAGKLDEALKHLQAAAKTNPAMSPPKVVASRWCLETNQGPQARVLLEQAASEEPGHPDVYLTNA